MSTQLTSEQIRNLDDIHARTNELIAKGIIERDGCGKGIICPQCGSGSHSANGDGPTEHKIRHGHYRCFAGCGWYGDAIDYIMMKQNCKWGEAYRIVCDALGLGSVGQDARLCAAPRPALKPEPKYTADRTAFEPVTGHPLTLLGDTLHHPLAQEHFTDRRLDTTLAADLGIRFSVSGHAYCANSPAIIIPMGGASYQMRFLTRKDKDGKDLRLTKGSSRPFNAAALRKASPVFIVEGWEDALSIIMAGGSAVSTQGTKMTDRLVNALIALQAENAHIAPLVLAFDNDDAGRMASATMADALQSIRVRFMDAGDIYGDAKDANEAWQKAPDAFRANVARLTEKAFSLKEPPVLRTDCKDTAGSVQMTPQWGDVTDAATADPAVLEKWRPAHDLAFEKTNAGLRADAFARFIVDGYGVPMDTGMFAINEVLNGGFTPGLFMFAAGTGCGKTTLALQICDYIAEHDTPVLYVATEMSQFDLMARSIGRISEQIAEDAGDMHGGTGPYDILRGRNGLYVESARKRYFERIAPRVNIVEGLGTLTTAQIEKLAKIIADRNDDTAPMIVVDYIQALAPPERRMSHIDAVRENTWALRALATKLHVPVFGISTIGRASYGLNSNTPIEELLKAMKESGTLEFTADFAFVGYVVRVDNGERKVRTIEARIVKGRGLSPSPPRILFTIDGAVNYVQKSATTEIGGYFGPTPIFEDLPKPKQKKKLKSRSNSRFQF